ncbi:MAG: ferredoxin, partial [Rhodobacteraceae bacterium]|nr:ferredoxin [Paracoccaceae bacterium]
AVDLPAQARRPCDDCAAPCLQACPAQALGAQGYDVPACRQHLDNHPQGDCRRGGCLVRRACPVSQGYGRLAEQSAYHLAQFHPAKAQP